ncbi:uncharacterized protein LOC121373502 isoform X1 [Gigantopelta aegis]|uniref:uncharacterized protein LOC121373502 isoform X1 n=1 Tax=Gigantopelta aegis TaxID=1735272 RepID=UPI001B88A5DA|nr:uncharacterized protein LOC121373502 isoform X1 [Gigantopelta aegis]
METIDEHSATSSSSKKGLSDFQIQKLDYYFKLFDSNENGLIEKDDLDGIVKDILKFTGWDKDSQRAHQTREVYETFFEVLFEKADEDANAEIDKSEWLHMWERLLPGATSMNHFPVWLRLLPQTLFRIIDRNEDGIISEDEMRNFYENFIKIHPTEARVKAKRAMEEMTDFGYYQLDMEGYEQIFANFLLGRTPAGPGKYIFGCFDLGIYKFKLIMPQVEEEEDETPAAKRIIRKRLSDKAIQNPRVRVTILPM